MELERKLLSYERKFSELEKNAGLKSGLFWLVYYFTMLGFALGFVFFLSLILGG